MNPTLQQTSGCMISCTYDWPSGEEIINIIPSNLATKLIIA